MKWCGTGERLAIWATSSTLTGNLTGDARAAVVGGKGGGFGSAFGVLLSLNGGLWHAEGDSGRAAFRVLGDCGRESGESRFSVFVGVASGTGPVTLLGVASVVLLLGYVCRVDAKIGRASPVAGVGAIDEPGPERFSGRVEPEP